MSSSNYQVESDVFSQGGGYASSTNFQGDDALGDLATGSDLSSSNFEACAGYECFGQNDFLSFTVSAGLTAPGVVGDPVELGTLSQSAVATSDGATINSIFITAESSAPGGAMITVVDQYAGLARASAPAEKIDSATATLTAGVEGYGVCVFSSAEAGGSPTTFDPASPFNGTCTKTTGHDVGGLTTSPQTILASTGVLVDGEAEILVKAAISGVTLPGADYEDTLTFVMTATY